MLKKLYIFILKIYDAVCPPWFPDYYLLSVMSLYILYLWLVCSLLYICYYCTSCTNIGLRIKWTELNSNFKILFHQYSYSFWIWFSAFSVGHLHNCCIVTITPMSAGQTTCATSAIPRLVSLYRLCTAGLKTLATVMINKQMKMQYINRILDCIQICRI